MATWRRLDTERSERWRLQIDTPGDFGVALLQEVGAPVTKSNLQFIIAWSNEEGGHWHNGAHFNPLNTTLNEPGATTFNSVGVKAYGSWDQGVAATAATLQNGRYNDIVAALQGGNAAQTAASATSLKTWSGGRLREHPEDDSPGAAGAPTRRWPTAGNFVRHRLGQRRRRQLPSGSPPVGHDRAAVRRRAAGHRRRPRRPDRPGPDPRATG